MHVIIVEFRANPGAGKALRAALRTQALKSLQNEAKCLRFDVIENLSDPEHFVLYEIYENQSAFDDHLQTDHFTAFNSIAEELTRSKSIVAGLPVFLTTEHST